MAPTVQPVLETISHAQGMSRDLLGDPAPGALRLSARFTDEQLAAARRIWLPVLQRLSSVVAQAIRLDCSCTPNGLIIESAEG